MAESITRQNVGRIAERIVANELEYRGFRVSDLNKEGISANADLLAAKDGKTLQLQVKGATWDGWWFGYGHCTDAVLSGAEAMFNRSTGAFYKADIVVLVCVKYPKDYECLVLPVSVAEAAAQKNLDGYFRLPKRNGDPHKPGKMWVSLGYFSKSASDAARAAFRAEQDLLKPYLNNWGWLASAFSEAPPEQ